MILAAAIKYHIEATNKDVVLCGARHGDVFQQLDDLGFNPKEGYKEIDQGFIDHKNNFLTRKEAYEHAKECGQLCAKIIHDRENNNPFKTNLISEDLWWLYLGLKGFRQDIEIIKSTPKTRGYSSSLKWNDNKVISLHPAFVRAFAAQKVAA